MLSDFTEDCPLSDYYAAITRSHERRVRVRVMDLNHGRVAWFDNVLDGQITIDVETREHTRVLNLQLLDPSRSIGWEPDSPSSLPKHLRRMVQIFDDRMVPDYGWISCPAGVFVATELDRDGAEVSLVGVSKEHLAQGSFGSAHTWSKGRLIVDVIAEIMALAGEKPTRIHVPNLPGKLQKDFHVEREEQPWAKAKHLAKQLDCVMFYNGRGHLIVKKKPTHPTLTLDRAWLTAPVRIDRPPLQFHNRWIAVGKKPKGDRPRPSVTVWLPAQNPFSGVALGRNGVPRWYTKVLDRPHVESKAKLREIAERARNTRIRYQADISLDCLPFPNVEEWDLIRVHDPIAGAATVQVKQATIPLVGGSQTIGAIRRVSRVKRHGGYHPPTHGGL